MIRHAHINRFPTSPKRRTSAFTLVELLTVMAIIVALASATVPAMRGLLDGVNVMGAADVAEAELVLARQTAVSRNLPTEVRFYKLNDGTGDAWRIMGVVIPASASGQAADEWVTNGKQLPGNIIMEASNDYSTVLEKASPYVEGEPSQAGPWSAKEAATAPSLVRGKDYIGFRFNADGSTNLPTGQPWCLTLKNPNSKAETGRPAANFVAIVLDSLTGRALTYQP